MPNTIKGWKALAAYTKKSESTCRKWVNQKVYPLPHTKQSGRYLFIPAEVDEWRATRTSLHPQGDMASTDDAQGDAAELLAEKVRLTREQANKAEFENRKRAGELLERSEYDRIIQDAMKVSQKALTGLRMEIERACPGLPKRGLQEIEKACAIAYNSIVDLELSE